jgi:hypothetical protein
MAKHIVFSDEQYEALIDALSLAHPSQKVNKHKSSSISKLPPQLLNDVSLIRDIVKVGVGHLKEASTPSILIRQLIILDSSKQSGRMSTRHLVNILVSIFSDDPVMAKNARDLVFDNNPAFKFPGKLVKHRLAEALVECGFANHRMLIEYKAKVFGQYPGGETMKIFEQIVRSSKVYSRDIDLLTRMGSSNNRAVAMLAVAVADKKILPYMVGISNKFAKSSLEARLQDLE